MLIRTQTILAGAGALLAATSVPSLAKAVACADLTFPNPLYGAGGSAVTPDLKQVALDIANGPAADADKVTIFYADPSACTGFQSFADGKLTGTFKYWIAGSTTDQVCDGVEQPLDFAHMGNAADFCPGLTLPEDIGDFPAPIQTVNLVTYKTSRENSISAEALYLTYGFGGPSEADGKVSPWTDGLGVVKRTSSSFVHLFVASAINVPATAFKWNQTDGGSPAKKLFEYTTNGQIVAAIKKYVETDGLSPDHTLGYVSGSTADTSRATVKTLAYRHYGQSCAVYPDLKVNTLDKANVRQGKYFLWTPGHFFARINPETKKILKPTVEEFFGWFSAKSLAPGNVNVLKSVITAGDIPQCAMQAKRAGTLGAISSYAPPKPCGCFFESTASGEVPDSCTSCDADVDCSGATPSCNFGFCEAYRLPSESEG